ncbi:MAG: class I SAM-dependent methyltransferase [Rhizobiales bacterium]|nr:class I SAM-dependent methyltransferase [Hyphomicrobiales bacterium]
MRCDPFIRRGKPLDSLKLKRDLNKTQSIKAARIFSESIQPGPELESCPLCKHRERVFLSEIYGFSYLECSGCGSAYVGNPPSESAISAAYRSDYYTAANKILLANKSSIDYRFEAVARPKVSFVLDHAKSGSTRWLDIGCGVGEILAAAKGHGFETHGIETNKMEADFARDHFGLKITEDYIDSSNLDDFKGKFDIISLFSVIEHVPDPNSILDTFSRLQNRGDTLVIETPHFPSISAFSQMAFPDLVNRMMHPPLHLFLFSFQSMEKLLSNHGYQVKAAWMFGQDFYEFLSTIGELAPIRGTRLHQAFLGLTNSFQDAIDAGGLSDEMLLVAERVSA